jgi:microsomal epoxide hydrolase
VATRETTCPPRELVEQHYDIARWATLEHGGHFPALENPRALVDEIRAFFRPLRVHSH